jgi:hypothetical protein
MHFCQQQPRAGYHEKGSDAILGRHIHGCGIVHRWRDRLQFAGVHRPDAELGLVFDGDTTGAGMLIKTDRDKAASAEFFTVITSPLRVPRRMVSPTEMMLSMPSTKEGAGRLELPSCSDKST